MHLKIDIGEFVGFIPNDGWIDSYDLFFCMTFMSFDVTFLLKLPYLRSVCRSFVTFIAFSFPSATMKKKSTHNFRQVCPNLNAYTYSSSNALIFVLCSGAHHKVSRFIFMSYRQCHSNDDGEGNKSLSSLKLLIVMGPRRKQSLTFLSAELFLSISEFIKSGDSWKCPTQEHKGTT